jgi:hypothetical protein
VTAKIIDFDIKLLATDDGDVFVRHQLDMDVVTEYAEAMEAGDIFPPVTVYTDGTSHWASDGYHRISAARKLGRSTIRAELRKGTKLDAIAHAIGANRTHGHPLSYDDRQKAIMMALHHPELQIKSHREIGRIVGCDGKTVSERWNRIAKICEVIATTKKGDKSVAAELPFRTTEHDIARVRNSEFWQKEIDRLRNSADDRPAPAPEKRVGKDGRKRAAKKTKSSRMRALEAGVAVPENAAEIEVATRASRIANDHPPQPTQTTSADNPDQLLEIAEMIESIVGAVSDVEIPDAIAALEVIAKSVQACRDRLSLRNAA